MHDHRASAAGPQRRDGHLEPSRLGRGGTRVLQLELLAFAVQHRLDALVRIGGALAARAAGRHRDVQVVGADARERRGLRVRGVGGGKARPRRVDGDDHAVRVEHGHVVQHRVLDRLHQFVGFQQGLFRALAQRDVARDAEHADDAPGLVAQGALGGEVGDDAVAGAQDFLVRLHALFLDHATIVGHDRGGLRGREQERVVAAQDGVRGQAHHAGGLAVAEDVAPLQVLGEDGVGGAVRDGAHQGQPARDVRIGQCPSPLRPGRPRPHEQVQQGRAQRDEEPALGGGQARPPVGVADQPAQQPVGTGDPRRRGDRVERGDPASPALERLRVGELAGLSHGRRPLRLRGKPRGRGSGRQWRRRPRNGPGRCRAGPDRNGCRARPP